VIFTVRHKLDEELETKLDTTLDEVLTDVRGLSYRIEDNLETLQRVWLISVIGIGAVSLGVGFTVGRLTQKEN
jgi:hypothetical protein